MIYHHIKVLFFPSQSNYGRKITHFLIVHVKKWMLAYLDYRRQQQVCGVAKATKTSP